MDIREEIRELAGEYRVALRERLDERLAEMEADDVSHRMIYRVLGVSVEEGRQIDIYQNQGRFLYRHAGGFLEDAARKCFLRRYPDAESKKIPNPSGGRPRFFEIDLLIGKSDAVEIKWRDATTDGDHVNKELARLRCIHEAGYKPIRAMFFRPNRRQAQKIQQRLEVAYQKGGGEYYGGSEAWSFVRHRTGIDLKQILEEIAENAANG